MATNAKSEEYISPEILTGILQFIPFQTALQVSRVNKDFKIATEEYQESRANEMATRIQRCFRRWRNRSFLEEIAEFKDDEIIDHQDPFRPPQLWSKYFSTGIGKRYGKALFKAYFTKFISQNTNTLYWGEVIVHIIRMLDRWENPSPTELDIIEDIKHDFADLAWVDRCGEGSPFPRELTIRLIEDVLVPYMDREGYGLIYKTVIIFGYNAPMMWENYRDVNINFSYHTEVYRGDEVEYDSDVSYNSD